MIAFTLFVVVRHHAFAGKSVKQSVLVGMGTAFQWVRQFPDHDLGNGAVVVVLPELEKQPRPHVGNHANNRRMCQKAEALVRIPQSAMVRVDEVVE